KNSDAFLEAVHRHKNIVAVAFGHVHSEQKLTFHGVDYLGSPSSSVQFMTKEQQFKLDAVMPGFRWFELYPDGHYETGIERVAMHSDFLPDLSSKGY
ncbi:MAG: phosphodiesterase, partial [Gammaproteobacteria bacterium]|nr:phosphodiesterase [Gammaproteobacteria bacterium]